MKRKEAIVILNKHFNLPIANESFTVAQIEAGYQAGRLVALAAQRLALPIIKSAELEPPAKARQPVTPKPTYQDYLATWRDNTRRAAGMAV